MEISIIFILGFTSLLLGFIVGRFGDKYGGHLNAPHHWIYGLILMIIGIFYINIYIGIILLCLGIGHFISDLDDFLHMRVWGIDEPHEWKFWSID